MIQIFTQSGRSQLAKQSLFAAIAERLAAEGVAGEDVFIGYVENTAGDWSFGFGRAQYVTGELGVPARVVAGRAGRLPPRPSGRPRRGPVRRSVSCCKYVSTNL